MIKYVHILFLGFLIICGCQQSPSSRVVEKTVDSYATDPIISDLLARTENLGTQAEQAHIKATYNKLVQKIEAEPKEMEAYIKLAQLYMLEARITGEHGHYYPAALKVMDHALQYSPTQEQKFQSLLLKGSVLLSLHQFQEAKDVGMEAVRLNPYQSLIYGVLVDAHVELGEYEEAVKMADKMVEIRPDLRSYARVSYLREIHGDVSGAIEAMKLAVSAGVPGNEDMAWCRLTLGELYENYGELEKAEEQYQLALLERPHYPFAIARQAKLALKRKDFEMADGLLVKACEIIPEVAFYEERAHLYELMEREEEAEMMKNEIIAMLADDEAHGHVMTMEYAKVYRDLFKDNEKALTYAERAYAERPQNIDTNKLLASIYLNLGEIDKASEHIEKAQITKSQDPEMLCIAVLIYTKLGEVEKGEKMLRTSKSYNPEQDHAFYLEALTYLNI